MIGLTDQKSYHDYLKTSFKSRHQPVVAELVKERLPLRTILHSLQNSVINSSEELKSRAQTGVDVNGALDTMKRENKHPKIYDKLKLQQCWSTVHPNV